MPEGVPDGSPPLGEAYTHVLGSDVEAGELDQTILDTDVGEFATDATDSIGSLVRSTYGPAAMEKLVSTKDHHDEPEIVVSGTAMTILDAIERGSDLGHPVAALLIDYADSMDRSLHDGTTATLLLTDALVSTGVDLAEDLHPGTIAVGYAAAVNRAGELLDGLVRPVGENPTEDWLRDVARTSMTANVPAAACEEYATVAARAVRRLRDHEGDGGWLDTGDVRVMASDRDELVSGLVVTQEAKGLEAVEQTKGTEVEFDARPTIETPVEDATIAVMDRELDLEETATPFGGDYPEDTGVYIDSTAELDRYVEDLDAAVVERATHLADLGVDVLVSMYELDDRLGVALREQGVHLVDDVRHPEADINRLERLSGATAVSDPADATAERTGRLDEIRQHADGDERVTVFERADGGVSTALVDAATATDADRRVGLVTGAVNVCAIAAMDNQVLPAGGAALVAIAADLRTYARTHGDRTQLAIEGFADALEELPFALAENAGLDPVEALTSMRVAHDSVDGPAPIALDLEDGTPIDAWEAGIVQPRRVLSQALDTANAAAEHVLTVDRVVFSGTDADSVTPRTRHD